MRITPEDIRKMLTDRLHELEKYKKRKENALKRAPRGKLRISNTKSGPQYYYRQFENEKTGIYLPKKEITLVRRLGQKDYDQRTLKSIENEMNAITKFLERYPCPAAEEVFLCMSEFRRELISPLEMTDEMFVEEWLSQEYARKDPPDPDTGFPTKHGEIVRSKSEWIIASLLEDYCVPFRYEAPIYLEDMGIVHPDFTVLNVRLRKMRYWEHEGMMDNPEYAEYAIRKERAYIRNGFYPGDSLILTSETRTQPLNPDLVKKMIEKYCL